MYPDHLKSHTNVALKKNIIPPLLGMFMIFLSINILDGSIPIDNYKVPINTIVHGQNSAVAAVTPTDENYVLDIPSVGINNVPIIEPASADSSYLYDQYYFKADLREGAVKYPGTPEPGAKGNLAVFGHSSGSAWNTNAYKNVFAPLHELNYGDNIVFTVKNNQFVYKVTEIFVVDPGDIEVLNQTTDSTVTLITCTPTGTSQKRLIIKAKYTGSI